MQYLLLFWEYFKIGLFTIGGGYAMLPMVRQAVLRNGWLTEHELINFIGVAESTPGSFAINLATFVGMNVGKSTALGVFGGFLGALTATFAVVLPSVIIIIAVTKLFNKFSTNRYVQGALYGIRPVVIGLIFAAVVSVGTTVVLPQLKLTAINKEGFSQFNWISLIIAAAYLPLSNIKIKGKKIHPIFLIISAAAIGLLLFGVLGVKQ